MRPRPTGACGRGPACRCRGRGRRALSARCPTHRPPRRSRRTGRRGRRRAGPSRRTRPGCSTPRSSSSGCCPPRPAPATAPRAPATRSVSPTGSSPNISDTRRASSTSARSRVPATRPCAHHRDPIGAREHLAKLVRDEQHRVAFRLQPGEDAEQRLRLVLGQHLGRLVEDEEPGPAEQQLEDLHLLPVAHREPVDGRGRVDREAEPARQRPDPFRHGAARHHRAEVGEEERHVLEHAHGRNEGEVLEHHADAALPGIGRRAEVDPLSFEGEGARVGPVIAVEDP